MGTKQFASYDQQQLDAIQQNTNSIHQDTIQIDLSVQEIKNTDLSNVNQNVLENKALIQNAGQKLILPVGTISQLNQRFIKLTNFNSSSIFSSVLNIQGKGKILALWFNSIATSDYKLIIDGVESIFHYPTWPYSQFNLFADNIYKLYSENFALDQGYKKFGSLSFENSFQLLINTNGNMISQDPLIIYEIN